MDKIKLGFSFIPSILWAIIIFILSILPGSSVEKLNWFDFLYIDKAAHCIFYAVLVFLILWAVKACNNDVTGHIKYKVITVSIFYGVIIEYLQFQFFEDRHFEILDIMANIIGSFLGFILFNVLKTK